MTQRLDWRNTPAKWSRMNIWELHFSNHEFFYMVLSDNSWWNAKFVLLPDRSMYIGADCKTYYDWYDAYKDGSIASAEKAMEICERHYNLMVLV